MKGQGDCAGIDLDYLMLDRGNPCRKGGCSIIELKPFDSSALNGNQIPGEAYHRYVEWLRTTKGIPCEIYFLISSGLHNQRTYRQLKEIQDDYDRLNMPAVFGLLFLEDIFERMAAAHFTDPRITHNWADYTAKGRISDL